MTSLRSFINQDLGLIMIDSLWQGLAIGVALAIALVFLRKPTTRYSIACIALTLILILPIISYIDLPTLYPNNLTTPDIKTVTLNPSTNLETLNQKTPTNLPVTSPRAFTFANTIYTSQKLEPYLPWLSIFWMLGVVILSLRLMVNLYLIERYRNQQVQVVPEWIQHKLQTLVQKMNLQKSVQLLQSSVLDIPAAVGFFKPVILLPASAICGLTPTQLELILAHELAHIQRRDYLVNLLQTLAETLLFYHPVVWWMSSIIRQEREHICDDMALQITGQERIVYAETLGRLETLRGKLTMAATGGNLVTRIRRLLGKPIKRELQWIPSLTALALTVLCVFALNNSFAQSISEPQQISQQPNIVSTSIAVNPENPDQIAINTTQATEQNCYISECNYNGALYTSLDGGETWSEYTTSEKIWDNDVYLFPDGDLYTLGSRYEVSPDFSKFAIQASNINTYKQEKELISDGVYKSKVAFNPYNNTPYLAYINEFGGNYGNIFLEIKDESSKKIKVANFSSELDYWDISGMVFDIDILLGDKNTITLIVLANHPSNSESRIFSISSKDGGLTFSKPHLVNDEAFISYSVTSQNGIFYITTQQKFDDDFATVLLKSEDGGFTWTSQKISNLPSTPYAFVTNSQNLSNTSKVILNMSLNVSENNMLDLVYLTPQSGGGECFGEYDDQDNLKAYPCSYDIFYTYSTDSGNSFTDPQKINPLPIVGKEFINGTYMFAFEKMIALSSSNQEALISWVGTKDGQGTQAYLTRVKR